MVYGLIHPHTLEIRYVGKTQGTVLARFKTHRKLARAGTDLPVYRWWRKQESEPCAVTLGEGDNAEEIRWIADLRARGARLLNCTDGGDGGCANPEVRAKIASTLRGRKLSTEHRAKVIVHLRRDATKGRPLSDEHKTKISEYKRKHPQRYWLGKKFSPEHLAKIGKRMKGNQHGLGKNLGNKHALGNRFKHTPEACEKIRAAKIRWWAERKRT